MPSDPPVPAFDPTEAAAARAVARYAREPSTFASRFFAAMLVVFAGAIGISQLCVWLGQGRPLASWGHFPPIFVLSSLLLLLGSGCLHAGLSAVKCEALPTLRRYLLSGLAFGTGFVGIQMYGLWSMLQARPIDDASTGVIPFVFLAAALHGMHFTIALMFLTYITVKAFANRYDHEYYWGVLVCTWFWHGLGMLWCAILVLFLVTSTGLSINAGETLRVY